MPGYLLLQVPQVQPPAVSRPISSFPRIPKWLAYCDCHPEHEGDSLGDLTEMFDTQGFRWIHQLSSNHITIDNLSEWLGIGKGTADLIIGYAKEDCDLEHWEVLDECFD
jgi:hypothetical protein